MKANKKKTAGIIGGILGILLIIILIGIIVPLALLLGISVKKKKTNSFLISNFQIRKKELQQLKCSIYARTQIFISWI